MSSPASPLTPGPFTDHATPVLTGDPSLTDGDRAHLWDVFHQSKDANELVNSLQPLAIPDDTKRKLWEAKKTATAATEPMDKTAAAIKQMASLDPQTLELAEAHPNVLKAFASAAMAPAKEAGEPSGKTSASGKGKTPTEGVAAAPLALPPRTDGSEHMPPITPGHRRIMASNQSIHDIPEDKIGDAFKLDPNMHVLNP